MSSLSLCLIHARCLLVFLSILSTLFHILKFFFSFHFVIVIFFSLPILTFYFSTLDSHLIQSLNKPVASSNNHHKIGEKIILMVEWCRSQTWKHRVDSKTTIKWINNKGQIIIFVFSMCNLLINVFLNDKNTNFSLWKCKKCDNYTRPLTSVHHH